jgi:aspartate carbamoyltransferase catalytic subunit
MSEPMSEPLRDLIAIRDLSRAQVDDLLDTARDMLPIARRERASVPTLRGRIVCNLFLEDSTRTRLSFDLAAKRLSADVVNFTAEGTSVNKGESLLDTAQTLMALGVDLVVLRTSSAGAPVQLAREVEIPVLNAGDGWHQHPTQALLDALTMLQHRDNLEGARVTIVGDVLHSRVARSEVELLRILGADVTLVAPPTLLPPDVGGWGVQVTSDLDSVLATTEVLYVLRVQRERMHRAFFPSTREYARIWGVDARRLAQLPSDALLMHPGPVNRGVELTSEAMDDPRSVIEEQVTNGIAVRMACLYRLLSAAPASAVAPHTEVVV